MIYEQAAVLQRANSVCHQHNTNNCVPQTGVLNVFQPPESPHKNKIPRSSDEIPDNSCYVYENSTVINEECIPHLIHNNHVVPGNQQTPPHTKYLNTNDYGNCDRNASAPWTRPPFPQRLPPAFFDQAIKSFVARKACVRSMLDIESVDPVAKPEITKSLETNLAGLEKKRKTTGKMTNILPCPVSFAPTTSKLSR
ncbi:uncharacterized protein TNIN_168681 [Trichonephila inaurata madagascariensis]|uniref:Uncharacterized protein n=1 Tax=Trichonephila inaurata madagascariensis TaxID=2747483 RepID=A0A8X6M8S3_9ARAC|nr:uncharacterized protein TNIN_168681 [Trichonephila inaurata madagascariensis]